MKELQNTGYQSINLCVKTSKGPQFVWLKPRESVVVKDSAVSDQARVLHRRRRIKIASV
tara:strand:- start:514 stop:690 length:177 start_codon:yes stop_codon:yes gene_type:complete